MPRARFAVALSVAIFLTSLLAGPTARAQDPQNGTWSIVPPPAARQGHTLVLDETRHRALLFGGSLSPDVWALELAGEPRWTQLILGGAASPGFRSGHSTIYDPVGDRLIVFGGNDNNSNFPVNSVWALSLSGTPTWTQLHPAGGPPAGRQYHAAFYDPARQRMVVFGGDSPAGASADVWALSLGATPTWTLLAAAGPDSPSGRIEAAALDVDRDRILFVNTNGYFATELREFPLAAPGWSTVAIAGSPPPLRRGSSLVIDGARARLLLYGGEYGGVLNETWSLGLKDTSRWEMLPAQSPAPARAAHRALFDPSQDRMVIFGGWGDTGNANDVWALSLAPPAAWAQLLPGDTLPPNPRSSLTVVRDELRQRDILFGGFTGSSSCCDDAWAYSVGTIGSWSIVPADGPRPPMRYLHSAIYDPVRDRVIVYGGRAGPALGDTWALSLSGTPAWTQIPATGPDPRYSHSAIYDPLRDRMIVFGGDVVGTSYATVNEVWALSLSGTPHWTLLAPVGAAPYPREEHTAIYDPVGDRMIVFGGQYGILLNDAWALSLSGTPTWTQLQPSGTPPAARKWHVAVYDPLRRRMLVHGGLGTNNVVFGDTWELPLDGGGQWTSLSPAGVAPSPRWDHAATFDHVHNRMLLFFGTSDYLDSRTWSLRFADIPTSALASLLQSEVTAGRVRLVWKLSDYSSTASVCRSEGDGGWTQLGIVLPDGSGRVEFEDRAVTPGASYAYRLGLGTPGQESFQAEVRVEIPRARLALYPMQPNPASGRSLLVRFALVSADPATLELLDVGGRRLVRQRVDAPAPGDQSVTLGARGLRPGMYVLRLTQQGRATSMRIVTL